MLFQPSYDMKATLYGIPHYRVGETKYCWAFFIVASTLHQNQEYTINQKRKTLWH